MPRAGLEQRPSNLAAAEVRMPLMQHLLFSALSALLFSLNVLSPHPKWSEASKGSIIDVAESIFRLLVVGAHPKLKH